MIKLEWIFKEPTENKNRKTCNPKPLKQITRGNNQRDDKPLKKEIAKKRNNPYYLTDRGLQVGYINTLDSQKINRAISKISGKPKFPEFGNETGYSFKSFKEMTIISAKLFNQYNIKYQSMFCAKFDEKDENDQVLDETEIFNNLNINQNLTDSDINDIDIKSPLEQQLQNQEMTEGVRFDKINSHLAQQLHSLTTVGFLNIDFVRIFCIAVSLSKFQFAS